MLDRLEIRQLKILQALLRELNVTRVAAEIGLSQQAISDQLRKLREIFGDPLFLRKSNGLTPTPFAKRLGVKIETLLRDFEQLIGAESFDPQLVEDTFTIAATDYAQLVVLPSLISKIRQTAPKLKIVIRDYDGAHLSELMAEGRIDLTITFSGGAPEHYPTLTLFKEHHVCVASKNSPLKGKSLSAEDISNIPQIIATPVRPNFDGTIPDVISKADLAKNAVITVPCFSASSAESVGRLLS